MFEGEEENLLERQSNTMQHKKQETKHHRAKHRLSGRPEKRNVSNCIVVTTAVMIPTKCHCHCKSTHELWKFWACISSQFWSSVYRHYHLPLCQFFPFRFLCSFFSYFGGVLLFLMLLSVFFNLILLEINSITEEKLASNKRRQVGKPDEPTNINNKILCATKWKLFAFFVFRTTKKANRREWNRMHDWMRKVEFSLNLWHGIHVEH